MKRCQLLSAVAMETVLLVLASPLTIISISNIMKYTNQTESHCNIEEIKKRGVLGWIGHI